MNYITRKGELQFFSTKNWYRRTIQFRTIDDRPWDQTDKMLHYIRQVETDMSFIVVESVVNKATYTDENYVIWQSYDLNFSSSARIPDMRRFITAFTHLVERNMEQNLGVVMRGTGHHKGIETLVSLDTYIEGKHSA